MTAIYAVGSAAVGTVLMSRISCILSRIIGAFLFTLAILFLRAAGLGRSDDHGGRQRAGRLSGVRQGSDAHQPRRGRVRERVEDLEREIHRMTSRSSTSRFAGTSTSERAGGLRSGRRSPSSERRKRGYVYKFICRISAAMQAAQVFVSNPGDREGEGGRGVAAAGSRQIRRAPRSSSSRRCMRTSVADGYEMRQRRAEAGLCRQAQGPDDRRISGAGPDREACCASRISGDARGRA